MTFDDDRGGDPGNGPDLYGGEMVEGRPPNLGRPPRLMGGDLFLNRVVSGMSTLSRRRAHERRHDLFARMREIDELAARMTDERISAIEELVELRDSLWPTIPWQRGRRPPAIDGNPLPPATRRAIPIAGVVLRRAALQILARHGPLPLVEIHAWLHRYGFLVGSSRPVKCLADALGYEHDHGRALRIGRGVYGLHPTFHPPSSGPDDLLPPDGDEPMDVDPVLDPPLRTPPRRAPDGRLRTG